MNKLLKFLLIVFGLCLNAAMADIYVNSFYQNDTGHTVTKYTQEWANKSLQFLQEENWLEAIRVATIAISLDPKYDIPYANRAWAYVEIGSFDLAIEDANSALRLNPKNGKALNNRGYAFQLSGDAQKAQRDFTFACELKEKHGCKNLRQFTDTRSAQSRAKIDSLLKYSVKKMQEQEWDVLISTSNKILTQDPFNVMALVYRARAQAGLGKLNKAFTDISIAAQRDPNDSRVHHHKAYLYKLNGDIPNAKREYTLSCKLGLSRDCETMKK